ncbi:BamA/TamA family outer membrane protein [bacterium]|nr:BamA/TamA family outer membrane protein [bacterium]
MDIKRLLSTVFGVLFASFMLAGTSFAVEDMPDYSIDSALPVEQNAEILDGSASTDGLKIQKIEFSGNKLIQDSDIMKVMKMQSGDLYSREMVQQNLKTIYNMGYFSNKMKAIPIKVDEKNVILKIVLEENVPITGFTIEGNSVIPTGDILEILSKLEGQPQNINTINEAINEIETLYAENGYILARVMDIYDDPDGMVNVEIAEGHIKSIDFVGNKKTKDFVVKRNILSEPGTVYNENLIKADLMRLYATQAFKDVNRTIVKDETSRDDYDITIQLEEQRTGQLTLGGGVDTATGFFLNAGFSENNFLGNGQRLAASALAGTGMMMADSSVVNRANIQAEISFFEPRLANTDISMLSKVFFRDFASYQIPLAIETRVGGELTFSKSFENFKNLSGSVSLGLENVKVREGDEFKTFITYFANGVPISERSKQLRGGLFATISPSLIYDSRDSATFARKGTYANIRFDQAIGLTRIQNSFGKLSGQIKQYIPVAKKSAFIVSAKAGGKVWGDMPEVYAFRLGGPYTVRGFNISGVGTGSAYMMASGELQTPLLFLDRIKSAPFLNNVKAAFFVDAGKVFGASITDKIYDRPLSAITVGAGLRVFVPGVGPLSIDYGIPVTNPGGSRRGLVTFGVGDAGYY